MAAATVVQHTSLPTSYGNSHSRQRSKLPTYDPLLSPMRSARWFDEAAPQTYSSPSLVLGSELDDGPLAGPSHTSAKLKKKQFPKHLVSRRTQDNTSNYDTSDGSATPMDTTDSEAQPSKAKHRRSISKESYLKSLHKRFGDTRDDSNKLDLSLTMEENEKRSGLAISSQSPASVKDFDSQFDRSHRHARTRSTNSISPSDVNLAGPTMGFMQPVKFESRPHTPLTNRHSFTEMEWKLCPDAIDTKTTGLGIDPGLEPRQRAATFDAAGLPGGATSTAATPSTGSNTWDAAASAPVNKPSRPKIKGKLSNGSSIKLTGNASQSTLSLSEPGRPRRSTAQSRDSFAVMSPLSRTSTDRTFSFKRGFSTGSKDTPILSEEDRAAAVDAAREQYRQKQAAKERKYDEQERKAKAKKEQKARRQSDASSSFRSKSRASSNKHAASQDYGKDGRQVDGNVKSVSPRRRKPSMGGVHFEHTPRLTTKKPGASGSSGFVSWCKSHILHIR